MTVAVAVALVPPAPAQVNENVVSTLKVPVLFEPLAASGPVQPFAALHVVALLDDHVRVEDPPLAMDVGSAVKVAEGTADGAPPAATVIVTLSGVLAPPSPIQVSVYVVFAVSAPVLCVPLMGNAPFQPPDPAQDVALAELHVNTVDPLPANDVSAALKDAVGVGLTGVLSPPPQAESASAVPVSSSERTENPRSCQSVYMRVGEWLISADPSPATITYALRSADIAVPITLHVEHRGGASHRSPQSPRKNR